MSNRNIITSLSIATLAIGLPNCSNSYEANLETIRKEKPNVIFILADDLGYNELGSYGQQKIKTPNLDKIASEGIRFTQHYSGSPVSAPSRCCLLTGMHTGHAYIRDNDEMGFRGDVWHDLSLEGQRPIPDSTITIAELMKEAGYKTGAIGKWGLGNPGSEGDPNNQGFDHFYGYNCQRIAHNYYPPYLWNDGEKDSLDNQYFFPHQKLPKDKDPNNPDSYNEYKGNEYSMDLMMDDAVNFIGENKENPFFLYLPLPVPHVSLQVPDESLDQYKNEFGDKPYKGEKGYLPHQYPRAAYAAMITRMDDGIGRIMEYLKELNIDENTLVIFTSDNGPTFNGGTDSKFFNSAGDFRGLKCDVYEGGIRIPFIARWPGKIKANTKSDHISAFWDFLPTFTDITGVKPPENIDGISLLPTLLNESENQKQHEYLYWEYAKRMQAVRLGDWKAVRLHPEKEIELYNLKTDIGEKNNVAENNKELINKFENIMLNGRTKSELFPIKFRTK